MISDLAEKISRSAFSDIFVFMLESHLPLKNLLMFGIDFTAPFFPFFSKAENEQLRALLSEPDNLQNLINDIRRIRDN